MFRKGDCPRLTARACFRVSSKTGSAVELAKSERTMVSFSVSFGLPRKCRYAQPERNDAATMAEVGKMIFFHQPWGGARSGSKGTEPEAALRLPLEGLVGEEGCSAGSSAALTTLARLEEVSRLRRFRSARMSEACW